MARARRVSFSPGREGDPDRSIGASSTGGFKTSYVRLCWVDFTGTLRYRIVPKRRYDKMILSPPQGLLSVTSSVLALSHHDEIGPGFGPVGEVFLQPDRNSYRPLPYERGHSMVMCSLRRKREPGPDENANEGSLLSAYPLCPRLILSSTLQQSVVESGLSYLVGFEIEVCLLEPTGDEGQIRPVDSPRREHAWSTASGLRTGSKGLDIIQTIVEALEEAGVVVEMWHAESAPGQFEIVLAPHAPFQSADELIFAREAIYNIANSMGARATFAPKPFATAGGNGAHIHLSLHRRKRATPTSSPHLAPTSPAMSPSSRPSATSPNISVIESHFLAGVLHHLPALCAFTMPTVYSYDRIGEGCWSGGVWVCWGSQNKEAPVRLCSAGAREHHFEYKVSDATSNIYLALSAVLTAGLLGIKTPLELLQPDCRHDPSKLSPADRAASRINTPIPRNVDEAFAALEKDSTLYKSLGGVFCRAYLGCKRADAERYRALPAGQRTLFTVEHF